MKHALKISCLAATVAALSFNAAHGELFFDGDGWHSAYKLFKAENQQVDVNKDQRGNNGYRIPAITTTVQGTLLAFVDFRSQPGYDIGWDMKDTIDLAYRISYDQGETWSELRRFDAKHLDPEFKQITDPSIVHDPVTGKTFAFGWAANGKLLQATKSGLIMYTSDNGGATWDQGRDITAESMHAGHKVVLQGPGKGMYYNDTIYMAVQAWNGADPLAGFIYSEDHGKTWKNAYVDDDGTGKRAPKTSESHVFHHKGFVYLAAKSEDGNRSQRLVYRTKDNGQNWERIEEDFFPQGVERCETSSLALSEDVYLAGYSMHGYGKLMPRMDVYITTNTGKRLLVGPGATMGYTSLDMDEDNIYVLFEGGERVGNMWFQRFDHASKEYANLGLQILDRAEDGRYLQDLMLSDKSYIKGSYGNIDAGLEAVYAGPLFNIGLFYKQTDENSKDLKRTIEYDTQDITLAASINGLAVDTDSLFGAIQSSNIDYVNDSEADVISGMLGYQAKFDILGYVDYKLDVLGVYSTYDLSRNHREGIGRTADFNAYSFTIQNALQKTFEFENKSDVTMAFGLRSTIFGHESFTEEGGNGWNNASLATSEQNSQQLFAGIDFKYNIEAGPYVDITLKTGAEFDIELADVEEYREEYTVLDVTKRMAAPIEDHTDGYAKGYVGADFVINNGATVGLYASADTDDESELRASLGWQF